VGHDLDDWFTRRGVPHFIVDYDARTDIWTRAYPWLFLAAALVGLNALNLRDWSWQRNLLVAVAVVVLLFVGQGAINFARRRPLTARPPRVDNPELSMFVAVPVIPSLVLGQWGDAALTLVEMVAVIGLVYLGTSYAVVPLTRWALRRSVAQLPALAQLVTRALPLLLLFTTFLFINAEVWQVAGTLDGPVYVVTLVLFFALGSLFVLSRIPTLMRGLARFDDWAEVRELVAGTPADRLDLPVEGDPHEPTLAFRERINIGLVSVFSQAQQVTFVAVLLFGFFVAFGFLAIPADTAAGWTGLDPVNVLASVQVGGRTLVITESLLRVAGFLGAFSGMYFTVLLSTDANYRAEFAEDVGPQVRQALAVRVADRWSRELGSPT
jgi:hypothetical protein